MSTRDAEHAQAAWGEVRSVEESIKVSFRGLRVRLEQIERREREIVSRDAVSVTRKTLQTLAHEDSAKKEARRHIEDGSLGYANADVVKLQGWDADYSKTVAQASLSALKRLVLSERKLPDKKSLYIRLGCGGDWPNIKPPEWDPSTVDDSVMSPEIL
ncbi:hypothetical protein NL676_010518 [Syzygium grande]|nr:hypothetical protein NL676_010518 [Syzygium grande]